MGLLDWLRSSDNPDAIETLLKGLAEQTSQLEGKQHRVAARRDSVTLIISLHGTLAYLVYLLLLYVDVLPDSSMLPPHWAVLVFWPLLILALRQLGLKFFNHRLRSLAHQLDTVRKRQHAEIEKLKKQTRYDETRALIERLESPRPQPQQQHQQPSQQKGKTPRKSMPAKFTSASATPQGSPIKPNVGNTPAMGTPVGQRGGLAGPEGAGGARPGQGETTMMSPPGSAARRGWADRFADVLLGENEGGGGGQYALICGKCFNHNGLVLKEELPYTQYVCPKCGHFNPPKTSARPANVLEVPPQLRSRPQQQAQRGRASMPSSMSVPSFGSLAAPGSDDEEEEEERAAVEAATTGQKRSGLLEPDQATPKELRKRRTGSSLADDARRQAAALAEVNSEEEKES